MQLYTNTHIQILQLPASLCPFLILFLINMSINVNKNDYGPVNLLVKCVDHATIFFQALISSITRSLL